MAFVNAGYDGTVDETQFAQILNRYAVVGPDDFRASNVPGADRTLSIANGTALGPGTLNVGTSFSPIQFDAVTSGTTRWDLVVLRRDWQPANGTTSIVIIKGGPTAVLPARQQTPGILDDQPLYLQQVNAGSTSLGTRIDLRVWVGPGGAEAADRLALTYLAQPGAAVKIGSTVYRYELGANGLWAWGSGFANLEISTSQPAAPANSLFGPGTADKMKAGVDQTRSFNQAKFTIGPADRISVNEPGLYAISWLVSGLDGASGSIRLSSGNSTVNHASLPFTSVGDMSISLPNIYLLAGDVIGFYFTATRSVPTGHRIRFSRVG